MRGHKGPFSKSSPTCVALNSPIIQILSIHNQKRYYKGINMLANKNSRTCRLAKSVDRVPKCYRYTLRFVLYFTSWTGQIYLYVA